MLEINNNTTRMCAWNNEAHHKIRFYICRIYLMSLSVCVCVCIYMNGAIRWRGKTGTLMGEKLIKIARCWERRRRCNFKHVLLLLTSKTNMLSSQSYTETLTLSLNRHRQNNNCVTQWWWWWVDRKCWEFHLQIIPSIVKK
jgi:hypothetical protein